MSPISTGDLMSLGLLKVAERAQRDPAGRLRSLAHHLDGYALERAYRRLRKGAAVGVDGVTKEQYGKRLQEHLQDLHQQLKKQQRYRHQPLRRVHLPKGDGRTRPIGISALEDKIVQGALHELLEEVYEPEGSSVSEDPGVCPDLGSPCVSRLHGGAGWWKSPSPDLARARGG